MITRTRSKVLGVVSFLSATLLLAPEVSAQCTFSRQFATVGMGKQGYKQVQIDAFFAQNQGNEIGRFWESADANHGNNFAGLCESQSPQQVGGGWWQLAPTPRRGVRGFVSGSGCQANSCTEGDMTLLVEDVSAPYWPDHAYFMALRVDPTPASQRYWDFSRLDRDPSSNVLTMKPFPRPLLTYIDHGFAPSSLVSLRLPDVADNVHSAQGPDDTPLPVSSIVKSYRLYMSHAWPEPGREAEDWTHLYDVPYSPGGNTTVTLQAQTICGDHPDWFTHVFLALGLTFEGGWGPDVVSRYVGSSLRIQCHSLPDSWHETTWPAGAVPDGRFIEGEPLRIAKTGTGGGDVDLKLSWGLAECDVFRFTNAIYEGQLGDFTSHAPVTCEANSGATITPSPGDTYYLVTTRSYHFSVFAYDDHLPHPFAEGSFGRRSDGTERGSNQGCGPYGYRACH